MKKIFLFAITVLLYSCSETTNRIQNKAFQPISTVEIDTNITIGNFKHWQDSLKIKVAQQKLLTAGLISQFYQKRNLKFAWTNGSDINKNGKKFIEFIKSAIHFGLDSNAYHLSLIQDIQDSIFILGASTLPNDFLLEKANLILTDAYFLMATHMRHGLLNPETLKPEWKYNALEIDLGDYLENALKNNDITGSLVNLQPQHREYIRLQKALVQNLDFLSQNVETIKVSACSKNDSSKCFNEAKTVLMAYGYLDSAAFKNDSLANIALMNFQKQHGLRADAILGKNTRNALNKSNQERFEQVLVSLEKLRWETKWASNHVYVNIPSYELDLIENEAVSKTFKVVVGSVNHKTPTNLTSEIKYFITYPKWFVPKSIMTKEMLPKLQKDSTYLEKRNYKIYNKENEAIDAKNVNWETVSSSDFDYRIVQEKGGGNALGTVKFIFPNDYSVYIHDTPLKRDFQKGVRACSHGCIRIQDPVEFANYLVELDQNEIDKEQIENLFAEKEQKKIVLNNALQVYIRYFSSEADNEGNITYFLDVYKKDQKIAKALLGHWMNV